MLHLYYSAIRELDFSGPSKSVLGLHQGVRNMVELGLKAYESLLAIRAK